jgi:hypothetical protein
MLGERRQGDERWRPVSKAMFNVDAGLRCRRNLPDPGYPRHLLGVLPVVSSGRFDSTVNLLFSL